MRIIKEPYKAQPVAIKRGHSKMQCRSSPKARPGQNDDDMGYMGPFMWRKDQEFESAPVLAIIRKAQITQTSWQIRPHRPLLAVWTWIPSRDPRGDSQNLRSCVTSSRHHFKWLKKLLRVIVNRESHQRACIPWTYSFLLVAFSTDRQAYPRSQEEHLRQTANLPRHLLYACIPDVSTAGRPGRAC